MKLQRPHKAAEQTAEVSGWQDTRQMSLVKSFDIVQSANFEEKKHNEIRNHLFYC